MVSLIMDSLRKEAEMCDNFLGLEMNFSLGGGTGSGIGSLLLSKLQDEFPSKMLAVYPVLSSTKKFKHQQEFINTIISFAKLIDGCDIAICLDNEALHNICFRSLRLTEPTHADYNSITYLAMANVTSQF